MNVACANFIVKHAIVRACDCKQFQSSIRLVVKKIYINSKRERKKSILLRERKKGDKQECRENTCSK